MKNILISGATGAIGSTLARQLDRENHRLILLDRDHFALETLAQQLKNPATLLPLDMWAAPYDHYYALGQEVRDNFGHLDGLIHCAGHCGYLHPLQNTTAEQWLRALQINLTAPFWLTQNLVPALQPVRGRVIFTEHRDLRAQQRNYWHGFGVAQSGLATMIDEWQAEEQALNIVVRRVSPPWLDNDFSRHIYPGGQPQWQPVDSVIPLYMEALL